MVFGSSVPSAFGLTVYLSLYDAPGNGALLLPLVATHLSL
jgi:hypothetical protein